MTKAFYDKSAITKDCQYVILFDMVQVMSPPALVCSQTPARGVVIRYHAAAGAWLLLSLLTACAPSPPPLAAAIAPPRELPALALIGAETKGYAEGLAAGKRLQARHDRAQAIFLQKKTNEAQAQATVAAAAASIAADITATNAAAARAAAAAPQISYVPAGPAIPVAAAGNCAVASLQAPAGCN